MDFKILLSSSKIDEKLKDSGIKNIINMIKTETLLNRSEEYNTVIYSNNLLIDKIKKHLLENPINEEDYYKVHYLLNDFFEKTPNLKIFSKSDFLNNKDMYSVASMYLYKIISVKKSNIDVIGYFSTLSIDKINENIENKKYSWFSSVMKEVNIEFKEDVYSQESIKKAINQIKFNYFTLAEVEGVSPLKNQLDLAKVFYKNNIPVYFDIIFDDMTLSLLPELKSTDKRLYDEYMELMILLLDKTINGVFTRHYLYGIQNIDNCAVNDYRKEKEENFNNLLKKINPLFEDLKEVKLFTYNSNLENILGQDFYNKIIRKQREEDLSSKISEKNNTLNKHKL